MFIEVKQTVFPSTPPYLAIVAFTTILKSPNIQVFKNLAESQLCNVLFCHIKCIRIFTEVTEESRLRSFLIEKKVRM